MELQLLFLAHRLIMVYICTKFGEIILNGLRVMERTRFMTDRHTDGQTDIYGKKQYVSPGGVGREKHKYKAPSDNVQRTRTITSSFLFQNYSPWKHLV